MTEPYFLLWEILFYGFMPLVIILVQLYRGKLRFTSDGLHSQNAFWAAVGFPFIYAFILSLPLISEYWWCWQFDETGYKNFISIFRLPIALLSISMVLGLIVSRFHASFQRDMQYKLGLQQLASSHRRSNFQTYYEHKREIESELKDCQSSLTDSNSEISELADIDFRWKSSLIYAFLFPKNSPISEDLRISVEGNDLENLESLFRACQYRHLDLYEGQQDPLIEHNTKFYKITVKRKDNATADLQEIMQQVDQIIRRDFLGIFLTRIRDTYSKHV